MATKTTSYLSHFTNTAGEHVWQVIVNGMPACPEGSEERARAVYAEIWRRSSRWNSHLMEHVSDIPKTPMVWNGDAGEFQEDFL